MTLPARQIQNSHAALSELEYLAAHLDPMRASEAERWPEQIERVAEWERLVSGVARKDGSATFFYTEQEGEIHYSTHGIKNMVDWSKTKHGGKYFELFAFDDEAPACSSVYGLCE